MATSLQALFTWEINKRDQQNWLGKNKFSSHAFIEHIWDPFRHAEIGSGNRPNDLNTSCWNQLNTSWESRM